MSINDSILQAVEIIADKKMSEASFDKTIQGTIITCMDKTIGKYKVKYQDSVFYAYSTNIETTYSDNSTVYILIPNGDMSKDKTILGATKKLGTNYVTVFSNDDRYSIIGTDCVTFSNPVSLCSYREKEIVIYDSTQTLETTALEIDTFALSKAVLEADTLILGAKFKTILPIEQQNSGDFGLRFELEIESQDARVETLIKEYVINVEKMLGQPYKMVTATPQTGYCDISNVNFIKISRIVAFVKEFRHQDAEDGLHKDDIFISDFSIKAAEALSEEELNGVHLSIATPQGFVYPASEVGQTGSKRLIGEIRVKGNLIDTTSQSVNFYWFREDMSVRSNSSLGYSSYGGAGWYCLNKYQQNAGTIENPEQVEYIPSSNIIDVEKLAIKEVKYKCVAIYDGKVLTREITIYNNGSTYDIKIVSDIGTQVSIPSYPNLEANVYIGSEKYEDNDNCTFIWGRYSNLGFFESIGETVSINNQYQLLVDEKAQLEEDIKNQIKVASDYKEKLKELDAEILKYKNTYRVDGKYIYNVNAETIDKFVIYKCSAYNKDGLFLGTGSITLSNDFISATHTVVINNATQTFQYDSAGSPPTSSKHEIPLELSELSFTLYDNKGQEIDNAVIGQDNVKWIVPIKNTLLTIPSEYTPESNTAETATYSGYYNFLYELKSNYNQVYRNNNIILEVHYKGEIIRATTNFTFVKEGDPGTNGTTFYAKIVPYTKNNLPFIEKYATAYDDGTFNFTLQTENIPFKAELYDGADLIFSGNSSTADVTLEWSILKSTTNEDLTESSMINLIDSTTGEMSIATATTASEGHANILKAKLTYDRKVFYGFLPLITSIGTEYRAHLKYNTGFRHVKYLSDGTTPEYPQSNPFEIQVDKRMINEAGEYVYEDVTNIEDLTYEWSYYGSYKVKQSTSSIVSTKPNPLPLIENTLTSMELQNNQKLIRPATVFEGRTVNNGILCKVLKSGSKVSEIFIPVHMYLDTTGFDLLNDWDGTSVEIKEGEGGHILAPQIGAGTKNEENEFSGVLMGAVQEAGSSTANKKVGLFGFSNGVRSIFLNAEDGSAVFGTADRAQIMINPSSNAAILKSGDFSTQNKTGMEINLSKPSITYGSGLFKVDNTGLLSASNATIEGTITSGNGSIGGWAINPGNISSGGLVLNNTGYIGYSKSDVNTSSAGFYLGKNGFSLGATINYGSVTVPRFYVSPAGSLYASNAVIKGNISATNGSIGGFSISGNTLYSGNVGMSSYAGNYAFWSNHSATQYFRVGHDGIVHAAGGIFGQCAMNNCTITGGSLNVNGQCYIYSNGQLRAVGANISGSITTSAITVTGGSIGIGGRFNVNSAGYLTASGVSVSGAITATTLNVTGGGKIGGFTIGNNALYTDVANLWQSGASGVYLGTDGIRIANYVKIGNASGELAGFNLNVAGTDSGVHYNGWFSSRYNYRMYNSITTAEEVHTTYYKMYGGVQASQGELGVPAVWMVTNDASTPGYGNSLACLLANGSLRATFLDALSVATEDLETTSSRRYKENIVPLKQEESDKILDIETYTFDYKNGLKNRAGVIAEEVVEVIPDAVKLNQDGEPESVNYLHFIPLMIKKMQQMQKEIDELKEEIKKCQ